MTRILVIRHGALGDIVLSTGPFAAIRRAHPDAHITVLTTKGFAGLLAKSPYFNEVWIDEKPKYWQLPAMLALRSRLNAGRFDIVYDLQTSQRSRFYFRLFSPKPQWSGISRGALFEHTNPERTKLHTVDRQRDQLAVAGIHDVPLPDVTWMAEPVDIQLPENYILIVPGGSAHRPEKRWPAEHYAELCRIFVARGLTPLLIGGPAEADVLATIAETPGTLNLCSKTSFGQIVGLAMRARFAIGNDTGPMHLIAAAHCFSLVLFSAASNPALCAPRGDHVATLRREPLADLTAEEVAGLYPTQLDSLAQNPNTRPPS